MAGVIKRVAFFVLVLATVAYAEDYDVGDDQDWRVPSNPNFYTNWASGKTFRVGDVLEFDFQTGAHDVAIVSKEAYDSCNKANPTSLITNGPANIRLNTTGPHYFICTVGSHCSNGQKLSVNVVGTTGGAAPSPSSTTPTAPTPPSGTTPTAPTTPSATTTPPPPNSASSIGVASFWVALMSFALAFLC